MRFKFRNPFANDPFLKTTLVWGLGLIAIEACLTFAVLQTDNFDKNIAGLVVPLLIVMLGSAYLLRFIGARPLFHCFLCGAIVGIGSVTLNLMSDEVKGAGLAGFGSFLLALPAAIVGLGLPALLVGWFKTRGRTPIEIEMPDKKELEAAKRSGREEPAPRILTPPADMPGSIKTNMALLEQLERDPNSLLSERDRAKLNKRAAKTRK